MRNDNLDKEIERLWLSYQNDIDNNFGHLFYLKNFLQTELILGRAMKDEILSHFKRNNIEISKDNMLEIGFGLGGVCFAFNDIFRNIQGIDVSKYEYDIANHRKKKFNYKNIHFLVAGAEKLPFHNNTFDFIFSNNTFEHVNDIQKSLNEAYRVLRKGGIFYLNLPNFFWFYEGHYFRYMFPYMPKFLFKIYLKLRNIDTVFLDKLNFVNPIVMNSRILNAGFSIKKDISLDLLKEVLIKGNYDVLTIDHRFKIKLIKLLRFMGLGYFLFHFFRISKIYPHMIYILEKK